MSYELRSARWIAADVLRQVVQPGDTVVDLSLIHISEPTRRS